MCLDFGYGSPACGEVDNRPAIIAKVHFLHFTILFVITLIATVIISLLTAPTDKRHVSGVRGGEGVVVVVNGAVLVVACLGGGGEQRVNEFMNG